MADIFISYARADRGRVIPIIESLRAGRWTVFRDEEGLDGRALFWKQLVAEIKLAQVVLVFWSKASVERPFVDDEARFAFEQGKLIAARLDDVDVPLGLGGVHAVDLRGFRRGEPHAGFDRIVALVKDRVAPETNVLEQDASAMRRLRKRVREGRSSIMLAFALGFAAICAVASGYGSLPSMRLLSLAVRKQVVARHEADQLRVVVIDETTQKLLTSHRIEANGSSSLIGSFGPLWRGLVARAIRRAAESNAKVIALDISFTRSSEVITPEERLSTTELASAILEARKRTAVVLLSMAVNHRTGELAVL